MGDIRHYGLQDVVVGDTTLFWVTREVVVGDMSHCG